MKLKEAKKSFLFLISNKLATYIYLKGGKQIELHHIICITS